MCPPYKQMPKGVYIRTKKHRESISSAAKGRIPWNKGVKRTEEEKKKISQNRKGIGVGKDNHFYGKKHNPSVLKKLSELNTGDKHPQWKGGKRIGSRGYVFIYCPDHPQANSHKCVAEHRLVMERHIGRYLRPEEEVHHINEVKNDNRIENLMLFASKSEHTKYHKKNDT